jgi:hypothetical protein
MELRATHLPMHQRRPRADPVVRDADRRYRVYACDVCRRYLKADARHFCGGR